MEGELEAAHLASKVARKVRHLKTFLRVDFFIERLWLRKVNLKP